jgi:hypothetical protein
MKNVDWPSTDVTTVAASSGRPLEVSCTQAFIAAGWDVDLGSYYVDGDRVRELDVLATKTLERNVDGRFFPIRVRAFVSCKGCRPTCSPLVYSVSKSNVPPCTPRFSSYHRNSTGSVSPESYGRSTNIEDAAAAILFEETALGDTRPLVAFDVIEREEITRKQQEPTVSYKSIGDRILYEGIDSALKSSAFWISIDNQRGQDHHTVYVPVLLLAPFWDVCIDNGVVGAAETRRRGYHSCRYPLIPLEITEVTTLVWSAEELPQLIDALGALSEWSRETGVSHLPRRRP